MQKTKCLKGLILQCMRVGLLPVILISLSAGLAFANPADGQEITDRKITLSVDQAEIKSVLNQISQKVDVKFVYSAQKIPCRQKVSFSADNEKLGSVLSKLLEPYGVRYEVAGNKIILRKTQVFSAGEYRMDQPDFASEKTEAPAKIIKGKVTDDKGQPLAGVSIKIKGSKSGTYSNENGEFFLEVANNAVLEISHVGFESIEVTAKEDSNLSLQLKPVNKDLDAAVVVGYGKQRKISVVGAQSTVQVDELKQPVRSLSNSLGGRLAGVIAVQRSGEPGYDESQFWIRGVSTFTSSNPLVLVDGIERSLNNIEPEDIQSFSILKDAAATAVYGVRGANGVVLITSKTGKVGKPQINFDYNEGFTTFTKIPKLADGIKYLNMANEATTTRGGSPIYSQLYIDSTAGGKSPYLYPNVNWIDELFNKWGHNRKATLNVSGGAPNARYYVSVGYYSEKGLFKTDQLARYNSEIGLDRFTFTSNLNVSASKTTEIELGIGGYIINGNYPGTGTGTIYGTALALPPTVHPTRYPNGYVAAQDFGAVGSPYLQLTQAGYATEFRNELRSNIKVKQDLGFWSKGLSVQALFSFDAYNNHNIRRTKYPYTYLATGRDANGELVYKRTDKANGSEFLGYSRTNGGNRKFYTEASLNYDRSFGKHRAGGLLLYNQSDFVFGFSSDLIHAIPFRSRGLAGRVTYSYDDRYFIEGNFGYNGSENFDPKKRYGFFPSAAIGWVASNENFFTSLDNVFQYFKLRASYGLAGNSILDANPDLNVIRRFGYISTTGSGTGGYTFGQNFDAAYGGVDIAEYGVPVTWETSKKTNIGIEFKTLNSKLNVQADWFNEDREGIFLRRASVPSFAGIANSPYGNLGIVNNKGIDATVEYNSRIGEVTIALRGNFTYAKNKVIDNDQAAKAYLWLEGRGRSIGQRFGYIATGLFRDSSDISKSPVQTGDVRPGDIKYKDLNGDGKIDDYDLYPIGYGVVPEIVYGGGFSVSYKGFDLAAFFQGIGNVDILLNGEGLVPFQQGGNRGNLFANIDDRWTPANPNPNSFYPRLTFGSINENYKTSTWWVKNGRYVRLKSLELGYTLPKSWISRVGLKSARIYLLGNNLFTFSQFKLWDVELGSGRGTNYPNLSTYSAGLSLKF